MNLVKIVQNRVTELSLKKTMLEADLREAEDEFFKDDKSSSKRSESLASSLTRARSKLASNNLALSFSSNLLIKTDQEHEYQLES